ncbi:MAG TPA: RCC1 domain-containing protein, partial [Polyangiaceae bacterium]|nr:RCC1 domain-containing protein [Polyangiaceae bacterium]
QKGFDDERAAAAKEAATSRVLAPAITDAVSIAAGGDTACTLDRVGQATCFLYAAPGSATASIWGKDRLAKPAPVKGASGLVEVAPGRLRSFGRTKDGTVLSWSTAEDATEVAGVGNATSVAVAQEQACASVAGGAVMCWSTRGKPAPALVEGLAHVAEVRGGGTSSFCARTFANDVVCWGAFADAWFAGSAGGADGRVSHIDGAGGATLLEVGNGSACAVTPDGVRCWGTTKRGALGDGVFSSEVLAPLKVALEAPAVDVAAEEYTTCAALADGRVRCWGLGYGGGARPSEGPASVLVAGVTAAERVATGGATGCALEKGSVACWGRDPGATATKIDGVTDAIAIAPGVGNTCVARASGETSCFVGGGAPATLPGVRDLVELSYGASDWSCGRKKSGDMLCWSMPITAPGPKLPPPKLFPIAGTSKSVSVTTSAFNACAARADGTLACTTSTSPKHRLQKATGFSDVVEVRASNVGTIGSELCARTRAGNVQCKGDGRWGELGTGAFEPPRYPGVATVKGIDDAKRIAAGSGHACALRGDGTVWCWGSNALGAVTGTASGTRMCAKPIARP